MSVSSGLGVPTKKLIVRLNKCLCAVHEVIMCNCLITINAKNMKETQNKRRETIKVYFQ